MSSILIISFSPIHSDPRVMRQVRLLEHLHEVTVVGYGQSPEANIEFVPVSKPPAGWWLKAYWAGLLLLRAFDRYYRGLPQVVQARRQLADRWFDLVIANDISALPLALEVARGQPVLIDAHEYSPREFDDRLVWRLLFANYYDHLCRSCLPRVSSMITVCEGIAAEYRSRYGVSPRVVYNAPALADLTPTAVDGTRIRLIHHGAAIASRHLELMIQMMDHLDDRFSLDLMLMPSDPAYLNRLKTLAASRPRVRFMEPVPMEQICVAINDHDIGVFLLPPVNFNYAHALPNKFFEFIQARLAVAIGPSPEMARLVRQHGCGVVADSFEPVALADAVRTLDARALTSFKQASDRAARELNYEQAGRLLLAEVERLL